MPKLHRVPTHLKTPESILTFAGVSLSVRQFLLLLVGLSLSYQCWFSLGMLAAFPVGQILRGILTVVPTCLALAFAFVRLASRTLDVWCLVLVQYWLRPRRLVWHSIRFEEPNAVPGFVEEGHNEG